MPSGQGAQRQSGEGCAAAGPSSARLPRYRQPRAGRVCKGQPRRTFGGRGSELPARLAPRRRPGRNLSHGIGTSVPSARDAVPPFSTSDCGTATEPPGPGRATAGWQRPQNDGARNAGASGCVRRRLRLGPSHGEPVRKGQPASAVRVPESCPMRPARASHRLRVPSRQRLHFSSGWTRAVIAGTESYRAVPRPRTHGTVKRSLWVANTR